MSSLVPAKVRYLLTIRELKSWTPNDIDIIRDSHNVKVGSLCHLNPIVGTMQDRHPSEENWANISSMFDDVFSSYTLNETSNLGAYYRYLLLLIQEHNLTSADLTQFLDVVTSTDFATYNNKRSIIHPKFHFLFTATDITTAYRRLNSLC